MNRARHCSYVAARPRAQFIQEPTHAAAASELSLSSSDSEEQRAQHVSCPSSDDEDEIERNSTRSSWLSGVVSFSTKDADREDSDQYGIQLFTRETDVVFEQELQRNPYQVKVWCSYLQSKKEDSVSERFLIYERAVKSLPGSYKLWWRYLHERVAYVTGVVPAAAAVGAAVAAAAGAAAAASQPMKLREKRRAWNGVNDVFERALVLLGRMPSIWKFYLQVLQEQQLITRTRRMLDKALQQVAITQHEPLWECCLPYFERVGVVESAVCLYRRCVMLLPEKTIPFVSFLQKERVGRYDEAATLLAEVLSDESSSLSVRGAAATGGKTQHQLWLQLCELVAEHPASISSLKPEAVLRSGISRFSDEVGRLWVSLASVFLRLGEPEKSRDVFEEAVRSVRTLQDLALVYDAYLAFEEGLLNKKIELLKQQQRQLQALQRPSLKNKQHQQRHEDDIVLTNKRRAEVEEAEKEVDYLLTRLEYLTERRPLLVSSCKLRQNPHNVHEWLARADLFADDPKKVVETFSEAVASVDPQQAVGRLSVLWVAFARFYEQFDDVTNACAIYEKAAKVPFRGVDDLASIWCEYVEMLLRHTRYSDALQVVRRAINRPSSVATASTTGAPSHAQQRLFRSVKLWSLAADVEEMFGSLETVRACYDKMFQLKVITPQLVINYAHLLEEQRYFEESFKVYERGIALFRWPHVNDLWLMYLSKFVSRFGSAKLERARELFQQATVDAPPQFAKRLYLLYAKVEEEFGLAKHALSIYHAATAAVLDKEKKDLYSIYIARTTELFGIARTRKIYEEAIENLPEDDAREMCMRYAVVECGLGEIDRCRAIYEQSAHFCDPSVHSNFWKAWKDFEVAHGNEETFKDMLRVKRRVIAQYSQMHHNVMEIAESIAAAALQPAAAAAAAAEEHKQSVDNAAASLLQPQEGLLLPAESIEIQSSLEKKKELSEAEIAQAHREFMQIQQLRAQARMCQALSSEAPFFQRSATFTTSRVGYVFKTGMFGIGYYLDEQQVGSDFYKSRRDAFSATAHTLTDAAASSAAGAAGEEELSIDLMEDVPEEVYGSLASAAKKIKLQKDCEQQQQQP